MLLHVFVTILSQYYETFLNSISHGVDSGGSAFLKTQKLIMKIIPGKIKIIF
jgi:hypothetical protein